MDPLTGIGLVGNILTFIDYSAKILSRSVEIYKGTDTIYHGTRPPGTEYLNDEGPTVPIGRRRLEAELHNFTFVTRAIVPPSASKRRASAPTAYQIDLEALDDNIRYLVGHSQVLQYASRQPGQAGQSLQSIAVACDDIARRMLQRLEHLRQTAKGKIWPSLKLAVRDLWTEAEMRDMERVLDTHQRNLTLLMVGSLRESVDLLTNRQEDQWNSSKQSVRDAVEEVIRKYMISGSQQSGSPVLLARLAPETLEYMEERQKEATKEIANAVNHALVARQLKPLDAHILTWPRSDVISNTAGRLSLELLNQEKNIMHNLRFTAMEAREDDISEVTAAFDWIFEDPKPGDLPWANFSEWLPSDQSIYWITGKPGSGKSTLMKYLYHHPRVQGALSRWAKSTPLVVASFFFWRTGTQEQKSQNGLFRSLLYQVLHKHRELIPILFSDIKIPGNGASSHAWTDKQLRCLFDKLMQQKIVTLKIVFFIDGLDEYNGGHTEIADLIRSFAKTDNIKVCASSRPLRDFELCFHKDASLMLQNLTFNDIKAYVTNKFNMDIHVAQIKKREPGLTKRFASEIVDRASGVFLWVKLAVQSILTGLKNEDNSTELDKRLSELPDDLMELYSHMLRNVEPSYQEQGAKFLQIVYRAHRPFSILQLAFCDVLVNDPATTSAAQLARYNIAKQREMCIRMESRLKVTCRGLLEVTPASSSMPDSGTTRPVEFMHQSVAEFLEEDVTKTHMRELLAKQHFSPSLTLMKANILTMRALETWLVPRHDAAHCFENIWFESVWHNIRGFMSYAATEETKHGKAQVQLVNQMDSEAARLVEVCLPWERVLGELAYPHWSERRRDQMNSRLYQGGSMISFALEHGLYKYVQISLRCGTGPKGAKRLTSEQVRYALCIEEVASNHRKVPAELSQSIRDGLAKAFRFHIQMSQMFESHRVRKRQQSIKAVLEDRFRNQTGAYTGLSNKRAQMLSLTAFPALSERGINEVVTGH